MGDVMPVDPVCGMEVSEKSKWKAEYNDVVYYFCCEHCLREFQRNPEKYVSGVMRKGMVHKHR